MYADDLASPFSLRTKDGKLREQAYLHEGVGGHDSRDGGQAGQQIASVDGITASVWAGLFHSCGGAR